jgi:preprotein translocase subunit SecE
MNTKAEQAGGLSVFDIGKLVLAAVVLAATIYGYYHFDDASSAVRLIGVMAGIAVALAIAAFTAPGRDAREFLKESQFELRKVVWPTREETVRTTIVILIVVVIISLLLGLIDVILKWAILDHLLKIG